MFPVCELVQSKGFDFPLLDHWSHSFAVGIIVCFVFCVILYYFFVVFLPSLRSVFMQTKAFGFAFPCHRSHFTRELWRLPATGASTVNSPCEYEDNCTITQMKIQLHTYKSTVTFKIYICNYHLCRTERDCLSLTSAVDLSAEWGFLTV